MARTKQSSSENSRERASLKSVVKVAMPHWRGTWLPSIATARQLTVGMDPSQSRFSVCRRSGPGRSNPGRDCAFLNDRRQRFDELWSAEGHGQTSRLLHLARPRVLARWGTFIAKHPPCPSLSPKRRKFV